MTVLRSFVFLIIAQGRTWNRTALIPYLAQLFPELGAALLGRLIDDLIAEGHVTEVTADASSLGWLQARAAGLVAFQSSESLAKFCREVARLLKDVELSQVSTDPSVKPLLAPEEFEECTEGGER